MKNTLLFCLTFLCLNQAFCNPSEELVVRLATETQLIPVYIAKFKDQGNFSAHYLQQLEDVLHFDFNHNGTTLTLPNSEDMEKLAAKLASGNTEALLELQAAKIFYLINPYIHSDKSITFTIHPINGDTDKQVKSPSFTGNLNQDRRYLHQFADTIHKYLFGSDGIASTHILYSLKTSVKGSDQSTAEIWEADYDGANAHRVVKNQAYNIFPVYIPPKPGHRSTNCLYVSYPGSQPKIYIASLKDGIGRPLISLRGNQLMPAITYQRDKIAFISDTTGNPDLFLQSFNIESGPQGKPQQIFSSHRATQGSPTFSPDGRKIAFVSNKDGSPKIYMMDIPESGTSLKNIAVKLISRHSKESSAPAWSPDGSKIAYCSKTNDVRQIWIYDIEKDEERQLTQGSSNKENPSWAPNSLSLVYNTSDAKACELYLINLNQSYATKITSGSGEKRFPNWETR